MIASGVNTISNSGTLNFPVAAISVGVAVAVFSVWLSEYWQARRHSRLRFYQIEKWEQSDGDRKSTHWRMPLENKNIHPAYDCVADLVQISDNGALRSNVVVAPLCWTHNPEQIYKRDIFFNQRAYLDICQWNFGDVMPRLSNSAVMGYPDSNAINPGTTDLFIMMYQRSGQRIDIQVRIHFDAKSKQLDSCKIVQVQRFWRPFGMREPETNTSPVLSSKYRKRKKVAGSW